MLFKQKILSKIIWTILLICMLVPVSYAKTQYVTDILYITLRTGPGDTFKVLKALKTGTKLDIIEENDEGYSLVTTEGGDEGWVRNKYLIDEPVAMLKLASMEQLVETFKQENSTLKQKNSSAKKKIKELEKDRKRLESTNTNLKNDNKKMKSISAKPIELARENEELKARNESSESQIAQLTEENMSYKENSGRDWFLAGGGVLFFGIIVGLVLPSLRLGKNKDWA